MQCFIPNALDNLNPLHSLNTEVFPHSLPSIQLLSLSVKLSKIYRRHKTVKMLHWRRYAV